MVKIRIEVQLKDDADIIGVKEALTALVEPWEDLEGQPTVEVIEEGNQVTFIDGI